MRWIVVAFTLVSMGCWFAILFSPEAPSERCWHDDIYWHCGDAKTPL
jgi:hypothetical protein